MDKLLLNGKDFFNGDKMVLLQNLPAYTVKNVQVYQQDKKDQLASKGSNEPDLVMDVNLKKEFNAGLLANAEMPEALTTVIVCEDSASYTPVAREFLSMLWQIMSTRRADLI